MTPEYVDGFIKVTAKGLSKSIAGVTERHVDIACRYLGEQIRKERASEFLTVDLMGYLEGGNGALVSRRSML